MLAIFDVLPPDWVSTSRPWTAVYVLTASCAQCAAVTILSALTSVEPHHWPLGDGEPLLFRATAQGVSAVCATVPPTIRVVGPSGDCAADAEPATATAPRDAAVSTPAARAARTTCLFPVMPHSREIGATRAGGLLAGSPEHH